MKIIVIGAGLMGISTAYYLSRKGMEVTVVDRSDGPGTQASFANGALLTPGMSDPWNAPGVLFQLFKYIGKEDAPLLLRPHALPSLMGWGLRFLRNSSKRRLWENLKKNATLSNYSMKVLRELREETGLSYDNRPTGSLKIFRDAETLKNAAALAKITEESGVVSTILDRAGVIATEPALGRVGDSIAGGIYYPHDELGDAHLFCQGLQELCIAQGVTFQFNTVIDKLVCNGTAISTVMTDKGPLTADKVVVAAGSYTTELLRPLGIRLPVKPAKGYSISLPAYDWQGPTIPVIDDQRHALVTPLGGRIRATSTAEFTGFDLSISPRRIDQLTDFLKSLYPDLGERLNPDDIIPWAGLRPMSADGVPFIGPCKIDNLFINSGQGHLGWTMAAGSARLLTDLMSGQPTDIDAQSYAVARK